jgi:hypothetical protein
MRLQLKHQPQYYQDLKQKENKFRHISASKKTEST